MTIRAVFSAGITENDKGPSGSTPYDGFDRRYSPAVYLPITFSGLEKWLVGIAESREREAPCGFLAREGLRLCGRTACRHPAATAPGRCA